MTILDIEPQGPGASTQADLGSNLGICDITIVSHIKCSRTHLCALGRILTVSYDFINFGLFVTLF